MKLQSPYAGKTSAEILTLTRHQAATLKAFEKQADEDREAWVKKVEQLTENFYQNVAAFGEAMLQRGLKEAELRAALFVQGLSQRMQSPPSQIRFIFSNRVHNTFNQPNKEQHLAGLVENMKTLPRLVETIKGQTKLPITYDRFGDLSSTILEADLEPVKVLGTFLLLGSLAAEDGDASPKQLLDRLPQFEKESDEALRTAATKQQQSTNNFYPITDDFSYKLLGEDVPDELVNGHFLGTGIVSAGRMQPKDVRAFIVDEQAEILSRRNIKDIATGLKGSSALKALSVAHRSVITAYAEAFKAENIDQHQLSGAFLLNAFRTVWDSNNKVSK